ncbi:MAG: ATP-binding protein [Acidimicrobiia bacterium]|nr:MAG: ATP-binding protein [Acidimicrobiia bacterium]
MGSGSALVGRERELERLAQALADERCRCCVLRGPAGTGKTRLAQECLARAEARGFTGRRVLATASARSVPLGAMAALVPPLGSEVNPLGAALRALRAEAAGSPLVLVVDDAQWLDETSAALVHQVVADGEAFGVLTV